MGPLFRDRIDAARKLSQLLLKYRDRNPVILGMARGGMVLAAEIARQLTADLDVLVVRKIGAPGNLEYGVGAIAPDGVRVFDNAALASLNLTAFDLSQTIAKETEEIERRLGLYREAMLPIDVSNRTVILVDDGLATGITAIAASRYVKQLGASHVVFAAPVCSRPGARLLHDDVDQLICLQAPEVFFAVGMWYEDFSQVTDQEVHNRMSYAKRREYLA